MLFYVVLFALAALVVAVLSARTSVQASTFDADVYLQVRAEVEHLDMLVAASRRHTWILQVHRTALAVRGQLHRLLAGMRNELEIRALVSQLTRAADVRRARPVVILTGIVLTLTTAIVVGLFTAPEVGLHMAYSTPMATPSMLKLARRLAADEKKAAAEAKRAARIAANQARVRVDIFAYSEDVAGYDHGFRIEGRVDTLEVALEVLINPPEPMAPVTLAKGEQLIAEPSMAVFFPGLTQKKEDRPLLKALIQTKGASFSLKDDVVPSHLSSLWDFDAPVMLDVDDTSDNPLTDEGEAWAKRLLEKSLDMAINHVEAGSEMVITDDPRPDDKKIREIRVQAPEEIRAAAEGRLSKELGRVLTAEDKESIVLPKEYVFWLVERATNALAHRPYLHYLTHKKGLPITRIGLDPMVVKAHRAVQEGLFWLLESEAGFGTYFTGVKNSIFTVPTREDGDKILDVLGIRAKADHDAHQLVRVAVQAKRPGRKVMDVMLPEQVCDEADGTVFAIEGLQDCYQLSGLQTQTLRLSGADRTATVKGQGRGTIMNDETGAAEHGFRASTAEHGIPLSKGQARMYIMRRASENHASQNAQQILFGLAADEAARYLSDRADELAADPAAVALTPMQYRMHQYGAPLPAFRQTRNLHPYVSKWSVGSMGYGSMVLGATQGILGREEILLPRRIVRRIERKIGRDLMPGKDQFLMHRDPAAPDGSGLMVFTYAGIATWTTGADLQDGVVLSASSAQWKLAGGDFDGDLGVIELITRTPNFRKIARLGNQARTTLKVEAATCLGGIDFLMTRGLITKKAADKIGQIVNLALRLLYAGELTDEIAAELQVALQGAIDALKHPINEKVISASLEKAYEVEKTIKDFPDLVAAQRAIKHTEGKAEVTCELRSDAAVTMGQVLKPSELVAMVVAPEAFAHVGDLVRYKVIATEPVMLRYNPKLIAMWEAEQLAFTVIDREDAGAVAKATAHLITTVSRETRRMSFAAEQSLVPSVTTALTAKRLLAERIGVEEAHVQITRAGWYKSAWTRLGSDSARFRGEARSDEEVRGTQQRIASGYNTLRLQLNRGLTTGVVTPLALIAAGVQWSLLIESIRPEDLYELALNRPDVAIRLTEAMAPGTYPVGDVQDRLETDDDRALVAELGRSVQIVSCEPSDGMFLAYVTYGSLPDNTPVEEGDAVEADPDDEYGDDDVTSAASVL